MYPFQPCSFLHSRKRFPILILVTSSSLNKPGGPTAPGVDDKYTGYADRQGVHINSGIPNHAFYLVAMELGGRAWGKAGVIWYDALRRGLKPDSDFEDCAKGTYISSGILYGAGSKEQNAVKKGWDKIGISI